MSPPENSRIDALLVGYENQENLGLRSILAYLQAQGYRASLVPFHRDHAAWVLSAIRQYQPRLVGFSLIFQYTIDEFGALMKYLRANGAAMHFTAGGHFPSLRPEQTLELLPDLDSVVRFEGELTLRELLDHLDDAPHWEHIPGLAYRNGSAVVLNPPRPLIADLDSLPPIWRDESQPVDHGVKTAAMLASRGCLFNCSFCSIRQFYGGSSGALRRARSPQAVVAEMRTLFTDLGVRYFSFQDDDFAARTAQQRAWLHSFLQELSAAGLAHQVRWKISCRVDDLEPDILETMLEHGLMAVYLGVESGTETGLRTLNKHVTVAQNLAAIDLLKRYNVAMAMGFMLFEPSSTVETLRENFRFLRTVGDDGYFPINFCKMLPYAGTPIETQLSATGRLKGTPSQPDYEFLDPQLNWYEFLVQQIFTRRNFGPDGLVTLLQQADFDYRLARAFGREEPATGYGEALRAIVSRTNRLAVETLDTLLDELSARGAEALLAEQKTFVDLAEQEWRGEMLAEVEVKKLGAKAEA